MPSIIMETDRIVACQRHFPIDIIITITITITATITITSTITITATITITITIIITVAITIIITISGSCQHHFTVQRYFPKDGLILP